METYNITIRRNSDESLFKADKVSFDWLLKFLKTQGFVDANNIKDGNEIMGRKSFSNKNATQRKIDFNK